MVFFLYGILDDKLNAEHGKQLVKTKPLYQDELTTDKKPTVGYSIPDEISSTYFQLCELV